jgi:hypothetical protein
MRKPVFRANQASRNANDKLLKRRLRESDAPDS